GMVMKPEPIFAAVEELAAQPREMPNVQRSEPDWQTPNAQVGKGTLSTLNPQLSTKVILMSPAGKRFDQEMATDLSGEPHLIIICGHYEGVDHRVIEHLVDLEISIGDYVLTNGAIAAVILVDATVRLLRGVLGRGLSAVYDKLSRGLLDAPQYTRPEMF